MSNDNLIPTLNMAMDLTVDGRKLSSGTGTLHLTSWMLQVLAGLTRAEYRRDRL
jgi:hypothetical protein